MPAGDLLAAPVQHEVEIKPAPGVDMDLGHVDAPDAVWQSGAGLVAQRAAACAQRLGLGGEKMMFTQEPVDAVLSNAQPLAVTQVGPDAAVAPGGMIGLECLNASEQGGVAKGDRGGTLAFPHGHASLFFLSSTVSSPMSALRRWLSLRRRSASACGPPCSKTLEPFCKRRSRH